MADNIQATPRNPFLGLLSDAYGWMQSPQRTQQLQGFAGLLGTTGIPQTIERMAYGEPLTNIGRANVPLLKPETADALMNVAPFAGPAARGAGRLAGSAVNEAMVYGRGPLAAITPQPMRVIDLNKGIYKPELTMDEMLKVKDIPTVDRVRQSIDLVGEKEFENMVNAQFKKYKPTNPETEAMLVESVTLNILGRAQRSPYPQEEAMRLAQQRAALPVEQGGLGLAADNTAEQRAAAMGFNTPALHGSGSPNIERFDPNLVGTKAGNPFDNYMWATSSPESASAYSLNTNQFNDLPEVKALNEQIKSLVKSSFDAYNNKDFEKMSALQSEQKALQKQSSDLYKEFLKGNFVSEGSAVYPVLLKTDEFMPYEAGGKNWMSANRKAIDQSKDAGFQGVAISNVKDNPNREVGNIVANTYATENPDLIRSRFAAFDPFRRNAAIAAAMGVAAPNLLAEEQPQSAGLLYPLP